MGDLPVLVVVSGPAGSGKTTLAHEIARAIGCPAICRDEIKHAVVAADVAFQRILQRKAQNPLRRAHADPACGDAGRQAQAHKAFDRVSIEAPWIEVNTADGYHPALSDLVAFVNA
jgi:Ni2+-binding GTPase involved in maturation of urease and hydrogenase